VTEPDRRPTRKTWSSRGARGALALIVPLLLALHPPVADAQAPPSEAPAPSLPPLRPPRQPDTDLSPRVRVFVQHVNVVGSTVFPPDVVARVTSRYENRYLTQDDLQALRVELSKLYAEQGFVNSGVILPDQTIRDGQVTYQVIEGGITELNISGNRWFREAYLRQRLSPGTPLNVNDLQRQIEILLDDPRIQRLRVDLKPGLRPGEGVLDVQVEDRQPFRLLLDVNNYQAPSVGAEHGIITVEDVNLFGWGDILTLRYGRSEGLDPLLDFRYAIPVTKWDTTLSFQYRRNAFTVIDEQFADLDIEETSEIYTLGLRQPLYRTRSDTVALELIGERLREKTTLLGGIPFPLLPGSGENGESVVMALRAALEYVHRTQNHAIALRSRFSVGIDALGATVHSSSKVPDGKFFAWLGQAQWAWRLPFFDTQLIARTDVQLTPDPLLVLEQVSVGGRYTVRGYRENTLVRDNAVIASLELRVPLARNKRWADYLELAPFFDYGRGWNAVGNPSADLPGVGETTPAAPDDIYSVGMGLRWALTFPGVVSIKPQFEVYFGYRLRDTKILGKPDPLQDAIVSGDRDGQKGHAGVHFQFLLAVF
jgi:hemolysin activation/secretion protein